jgi:hypothetical protein
MSMMADPDSNNDFVKHPPRGWTLLRGASQSQDSGAKDQSLDVTFRAVNQKDTATNVVGISTKCRNCDVIPFWDFSRNLIAGAAAAFEDERFEVPATAVLDEQPPAIAAGVIAPRVIGRYVGIRCVAAEHGRAIAHTRLIDDAHRHNGYRFFFGSSGHVSDPCVSPPRRKHCNRTAEAPVVTRFPGMPKKQGRHLRPRKVTVSLCLLAARSCRKESPGSAAPRRGPIQPESPSGLWGFGPSLVYPWAQAESLRVQSAERHHLRRTSAEHDLRTVLPDPLVLGSGPAAVVEYQSSRSPSLWVVGGPLRVRQHKAGRRTRIVEGLTE